MSMIKSNIKIEKVVETKTCKHCNSRFEITNEDLDFYEKVSPVFNSETGLQKERLVSASKLIKNLGNGKIKYLIPSPTICPDCRYQRKLSWRNERNLYKGKCSKCKKNIVSMYSPDKNIDVYCQECWWSDDEDFLNYPKDFDFSKSFFENFQEVYSKVPKVCLTNTYKVNENSHYVNYIVNAKNSYLCFGGGIIEDVAYSNFSLRTKNSFDIYSCDMCENCYEIINCKNCFKLFFSANSESCNNCYFLDNCEGCSFCIGCKNLKNKKYYIFNKQSSKEEYQEILKELSNNLGQLKDKISKLFFKIPSKYLEIKNSENCIGNIITDSKNCQCCFNIKESENIKYTHDTLIGHDIYDTCYVGLNVSKVYETINTSINTQNLLFSSIVRDNARDIIYSMDIHSCSNCFGCVGLKNKSYCILNKQYTKEEYNRLVPKIIEHMMRTGERGEFFPSSLSPFGYNETVAEEYFPIEIKTDLNKKDIKYIDREGNTYKDLKEIGERPVFKYSSYESLKPKVDKIIPASKLPENIADIPDDILNRAIMPEHVRNDSNRSQQKPFRIIREELDFYRKHNLPIPRRHPDQRHLDRMKLRNPRRLYDRKCDKCGKEIKTTYSSERHEIVYCEECYNKEMY